MYADEPAAVQMLSTVAGSVSEGHGINAHSRAMPGACSSSKGTISTELMARTLTAGSRRAAKSDDFQSLAASSFLAGGTPEHVRTTTFDAEAGFDG